MNTEESKGKRIKGSCFLPNAAIGLVLWLCLCFAPFVSDSVAGNSSSRMGVKLELELIASGFKNPVHIASVPDLPGLLYVLEEQGRIILIEHGKKSEGPPFMDLTIVEESEEPDDSEENKIIGPRRFFSLAFHPKFVENGKFYLSYAGKGRHTLKMMVSEIVASAAKGKVTLSDPKTVVSLDQPISGHSGGALGFGPGGALFVGVGDGGGSHDPKGNGQNPKTLFGSILRLDIDLEDPQVPYVSPSDNPFVMSGKGAKEVWAFGFRDPWKMSFDRETGELWVGDRGEDIAEEINLVHSGRNYGWSIYQGTSCMRMTFQCLGLNQERPVIEYLHRLGNSVTGGYVYRGSRYAKLKGIYLYGDGQSGRIWGLRYSDGRVTAESELLDTHYLISSFGEDTEGELYLSAYRRGEIYSIGVKGAGKKRKKKAS